MKGVRSNVLEFMFKVVMGVVFVVFSLYVLLFIYGGGEEDWKVYCRWYFRNEVWWNINSVELLLVNSRWLVRLLVK